MKQITYFNGLKGIAALLVLVNHMALCFDPSSPLIYAWKHRVIHFMNAGFAVDIFVILSAYLAYKGIASGKKVDDMLLKRYFRLAIPVGCILILMGIAKYCGLFFCDNPDIHLSSQWLIGEPRNYSELYKAVLMSPFGLYYGWMNPLWMMKYVFFAPFIVLLLYKALENVRPLAKYLLLLLLFLLFLRFEYQYIDVIVGFVLADIANRPLSSQSGVRRKAICVAALLALVLLEFTDFFMINMFRALFVLVACAYSNILQKAIGCKPLNWLGNISMGIYLVHVFVLCTFGSYLLLELPDDSFRSPIAEAATILCTLLLAIIYINYVERYTANVINWGLAKIKK